MSSKRTANSRSPRSCQDLDEKNVEVKLANGNLTIKGEKKEEKEEREKDYYVSERRYGSFVRSFPVPEGVSADKIEATFAKGVLTVRAAEDHGGPNRKEDRYQSCLERDRERPPANTPAAHTICNRRSVCLALPSPPKRSGLRRRSATVVKEEIAQVSACEFTWSRTRSRAGGSSRRASMRRQSSGTPSAACCRW